MAKTKEAELKRLLRDIERLAESVGCKIAFTRFEQSLCAFTIHRGQDTAAIQRDCGTMTTIPNPASSPDLAGQSPGQSSVITPDARAAVLGQPARPPRR